MDTTPHKYRLTVWQHGELLGFFETEAPGAREALATITAQLPAEQGFRTQRLVAYGERRILESGPDGLRLLGAEALFQAAPLAE
ncbi:cytoplasmic protein [Jeongeupia naejangsanensis]|uniref:Cytoplasmic protein n=1 Tax=Jeongeupia naejangsanensis TaxID=613195 RepID=A0ABS2BP97_9NEIS|nr:cytoplasmic protein [Jeongeupia naejangsanensis]